MAKRVRCRGVIMLTEDQYRYLDDALRRRPTVRPNTAPYPVSDGHVPVHRACQLTAMHLERTRGWGAQIGVQWLDKMGRLLPWTHVVNWMNGSLVDYSCPVLEPKIGFTLIGNDVDMANSLTASVEDREIGAPGSPWADPLLWKLHVDWFDKLKRFSVGHQQTFDPLA